MMPLLATRESAKVVFPWSTWAKMHRFRMFFGFFWSSVSFSIGITRIVTAGRNCKIDVTEHHKYLFRKISNAHTCKLRKDGSTKVSEAILMLLSDRSTLPLPLCISNHHLACTAIYAMLKNKGMNFSHNTENKAPLNVLHKKDFKKFPPGGQ